MLLQRGLSSRFPKPTTGLQSLANIVIWRHVVALPTLYSVVCSVAKLESRQHPTYPELGQSQCRYLSGENGFGWCHSLRFTHAFLFHELHGWHAEAYGDTLTNRNTLPVIVTTLPRNLTALPNCCILLSSKNGPLSAE